MRRDNWVPDIENDPLFYTMKRTSDRGAKMFGKDMVLPVRLYRPLVVGDPIQGEVVDVQENKVSVIKLAAITGIKETGIRKIVSFGKGSVFEFIPRPQKSRG